MNTINDFIKSLNVFENVNNFFKDNLPKSQKLKIIKNDNCIIRELQKIINDDLKTINKLIDKNNFITPQSLFFFKINNEEGIFIYNCITINYIYTFVYEILCFQFPRRYYFVYRRFICR